jgi:hypothetical protein
MAHEEEFEDTPLMLERGAGSNHPPLGPYATSQLALDAANFFIADVRTPHSPNPSTLLSNSPFLCVSPSLSLPCTSPNALWGVLGKTNPQRVI